MSYGIYYIIYVSPIIIFKFNSHTNFLYIYIYILIAKVERKSN